MTKWPVQKKNKYLENHEQAEQQDVKYLKNKLFLCLFLFVHFYFYCIYTKMISPRNVELPPWYGQ